MHEHRAIYSTDILSSQVSVFGHFSESPVVQHAFPRIALVGYQIIALYCRSLETLLASQINFLKNAQDGSERLLSSLKFYFVKFVYVKRFIIF